MAEKLIQHISPDYLHYNGDILDFYPISKFDKKPWKVADLQSEFDKTSTMFLDHSNKFKRTRKYYELGNHEDRLRRYLWSIAKELSQLRCLELETLLSFKEYDIEKVDYEEGVLINEIFLVIHGDLVSAHSGYTAKRLFEKHGGSGVCNHTHRGGSFYKRNRFGTYGWWENFCLCDLEPDYIENPNWQQGITVVEFIKDRFFVEQIPIISGKCVYGGKLFEADNG